MPNFREDSYDRLVGVIYDAARDPLLLKGALAATVSAVGARAGSLTIVDRKLGTAVMAVSSGTSPIADLDYVERYGRTDPRAEIGMKAAIGKWLQCHHYLSPAYVERSPFFQEFLIPYGFRWNCGSRLFETESYAGLVGIHSGIDQEPLGPEALSLLERLTPHWQRSLDLQRGIMALHSQWTMVRSLLNAMGYAALLCDVNGVVVVANDAALELLRVGDGIELRGDTLRLSDTDAQSRFSGILAVSAELSLGPPKPGSAAGGPDGAMLVPRPSRKPALQLLLRRLQPNQTLLNLGGADRFVVTISDPVSVSVPHIRAIALLYALTPAESRLARLLLEGASLEVAALELGTTLATVRTQVKSLLARTQTHRQAELVALLKSAVTIR